VFGWFALANTVLKWLLAFAAALENAIQI